MTAYVVVTLNITDADTLAKYRAVAVDALNKHQGKVASASGNVEILEGAPATPDSMVVLEFPDHDHARAWRNDPELQDIHALRMGGADTAIYLLG